MPFDGLHCQLHGLLLIYRPRMDGRLSWSGWLTHSGLRELVSTVSLCTTNRALSAESGLRVAVWLQVKVRGRELWLSSLLAVRPLCLWHNSAAAAAVCGLWRYASVICCCRCLRYPRRILWLCFKGLGFVLSDRKELLRRSNELTVYALQLEHDTSECFKDQMGTSG